MNPRTRLSATLAVAAIFTTSAAAQLVPVSQSRGYTIGGSIVTNEDFASDGNSDSANDFGFFSSGNGCSVRLGDSSVDGFARHSSSIDAFLIEGQLSADINAYAGEDEANASGSGGSFFSLQFEILVPQTWLITASGGVSGSGYSEFHLIGGSIEPHDFYFDPFGSVDGYLIDLGPGIYFLDATAGCGGSSSGAGNQSAAIAGLSFRMEYVAPTPGTLALVPAWLVMLRRRR